MHIVNEQLLSENLLILKVWSLISKGLVAFIHEFTFKSYLSMVGVSL